MDTGGFRELESLALPAVGLKSPKKFGPRRRSGLGFAGIAFKPPSGLAGMYVRPILQF